MAYFKKINGYLVKDEEARNKIEANKTELDNAITSLTSTVTANKTELQSNIDALSNTVSNNSVIINGGLTTLSETINEVDLKVDSTKEELQTNITAINDKFVLIEGEMAVSTDQQGNASGYVTGIAYPEGFTPENCVVISVMAKPTAGSTWYYNSNAGTWICDVRFRTSDIAVAWSINAGASGTISSETIPFKLVLYKIA